MHQHRQVRIDERRDRVSLQIDLYVERKASITLSMFDDLYNQLGYESDHNGLERLMRGINPHLLMEDVRDKLDRAEGKENAVYRLLC